MTLPFNDELFHYRCLVHPPSHTQEEVSFLCVHWVMIISIDRQVVYYFLSQQEQHK